MNKRFCNNRKILHRCRLMTPKIELQYCLVKQVNRVTNLIIDKTLNEKNKKVR